MISFIKYMLPITLLFLDMPMSSQAFDVKSKYAPFLKIGIGQMQVEGGNPEINLENAVSFIAQAAAENCQIIVLPECIDFGWTNSSAKEGAKPVPGPYCQILQDAARTHQIYVVAGLTELDEERIYNTAVILSPMGELLGKHRKINILDIAQHLYTPGSMCQVIETDLGKIGFNICADNSPSTNQLGHSLALMGADIILSPCSWAVPPDFDNDETPYGDIWKKSYREIASKHQIPVIGVSNTGLVKDGAWKGWWCIGASLVVSKDGNIQRQFEYTKEGSRLYTIDVELR